MLVEKAVALSAILFVLGALGALTRRNLIIILMSIELMLNAVNLALGIVIALFRNRESVNVEDSSLLKW